jgi:hypothetical protein
MLTDEQLIQRIGAELQARLAILDPPEDLLEQLRERRTRDRGRWRERTREPASRAWVVLGFVRAITVLSVAVVIAIAVGALVLLGGHRSSPIPNTTGGVASRHQLLETLGVLRSPPSAADRRAIACAKSVPRPPSVAFRTCRTSGVPSFFVFLPRSGPGTRQMNAQFGYPRLDSSLIRIVPIPHLHASVTIAPATWQPSPHSPRRAEGIELALNQPRGQSGTGPKPTSLTTVINHGLAITNAQMTPSQRTVFGAMLVPDGVAKLTLEPIRVFSPPAPLKPSQFGRVTTHVHDNVASFQVPVPTATNPQRKSALYGVAVIAKATWFDRHGRIIDRITTQLYLSINLHGKGVSRGTIP